MEKTLTTEEVSNLLGVKAATVRYHAQRGIIAAERNGGRAYRYALPAVVAYWRAHWRGHCRRCTILGEATPERGFMCKPCQYEEENQTLYPWPVHVPARPQAMQYGRLLIDVGGSRDPPEE